jgi:hypothetical protein
VIEEASLATGQVRTLLDASAFGFPGSFVYMGPHQAIVGLGMDVYRWDPSSSALGELLTDSPDSYAFTYDGDGGLLGTRTAYLADGGSELSIVRRPLAGDAGASTVSANPFTDPTGFVGGVEVWPHP